MNRKHNVIAIFISIIICVVVDKKEVIFVENITCLYKIYETDITIARQQQ